MRVVVVVPWGARLGGAETMLWTFLRHVDRARVDPLVVFLQPGPFEGEVARLGFRTAVVPAGRLREAHRFARVVVRLARTVRSERADLVLAWSPKTHLDAAPAALVARRPVVWWQHGIPRGGWLDRAATLLPARAVGCSSVASAAAQASLRPRRRCFVVHPGVDEPSVPAVERRGERPVVGVVGRLQPWKRQHLVLEAVAAVRRRGLDVDALVVGGDAYDLSPEYGPELRRLAARLGIEGAVTFTGQVEDPAPYLARMDVVVSAAAEEPFGIAVVEALALGRPVVAFAGGGPAEIVEHERSGLLVSGGAAELAGALERALRDDVLRGRLAAGARARYEQRFTAERMTEELTRRLEDLRCD